MKTRGQPINGIAGITGASWPTLLALFGLAIIIDLTLGGRAFLGRLPGPDQLLGSLATFFRARLDRPNRSPAERLIRGLIVVLIIVPILFVGGLALGRLIHMGTAASAVLSLLLALTIRQRLVWDAAVAAGKTDPAEVSPRTNRHHVQAAMLRFSDSVVVNMLLFTLGGFALLLPYRFLRLTMDLEMGADVALPSSPYGRAFWPMAELLALPGSMLAGFLLAMAHIFIPGTRLAAFAGLFVPRKGAAPSRLLPLSTLAYGLGLSFRMGGTASERWLGPRDGRAKVNRTDVRFAGMVLIVAHLLGLLVALLLAGFALTR